MRKKRAHGLLVGLACALAASGCGGDGDDKGKANSDGNSRANVNTNTGTNVSSNAATGVGTNAGATETPAATAHVVANANDSGGGGGESVERALAEVASFTDELLKRIEDASDASAGVGAAQKFFDSRAGEMRARVVAAKRSAQGNSDARRTLLESEVDNNSRISALQTKYLDRSMSDAAFKTRLDKLVGDYRKLFED